MNPFSSYKELLRQTVLEPTITPFLFPTITEHAPYEMISGETESDLVYPYGFVLDDNYEEESYKQVCLCVYHLTITPYGGCVQYLLDDEDSGLNFLHLEQSPDNIDAICQTLDSERQLASLCFKGYFRFDEVLCLFFQSSAVTDECWVTIDEICNAKCYKSKPIGRTVTELFLSNPCFLAPGSNGKQSDIPVVGTCVQQPQGAIFGNAIYFVLGYQSSLEQRCAIFLAKCKVIVGAGGEADRSIGSQLAELTKGISHAEVLKLIDCDGRWRDEYDSIIIGRIKLGSYMFANEPMCAVKSPEQFIYL